MRQVQSLSLLFLLVCGFVFTSCQREVVEPPQPPISSKNPAALSAALRVWHGTRTQGMPPAPTGNNPAIDPAANPTIRAIAGRYAIIKPEITSGTVAGYYLGISGAGQFFKVDFSKPRDIAGRGIRAKKPRIFLDNGTADSSIVIVLPPNINAPDTFCVTYCPYDSLGNIGQPVTTCIYVASFGADPSQGWLQNDFKVTSFWQDSSGFRIDVDTTIFNRWYNADNRGYICFAGPPPQIINVGPGQGTWLVSDSTYTTKNNIRFATNGAFDYKDITISKELDWVSSTCSQFIFNPPTNYSDSTIGAYSYNANTNKLVFIFEFDAVGIPDPEYWEYDVIKISNNHFLLRDPIDNFFIRMER